VDAGGLVRVAPGSATAAFALVAACNSGSVDGPPGFSSWDSAGVRIARNGGALVHDAPMLRAEEDLRIGAASGRPEEELAGPVDIAVGSNGDIYAVDAVARTIRVFADDGRPLRSFGGPGEGPGEFGFQPFDGASGAPIVAMESTLRRYLPDMGRSREKWLGPRATAAVRTNGEIYTVAGDAYEIVVRASDGRMLRRIRADVERIEADALDVPYIVRYRIVRDAR